MKRSAPGLAWVAALAAVTAHAQSALPELPAVEVRASAAPSPVPNVLGTPGDLAQAPAQVSVVPAAKLAAPGSHSLSSALDGISSIGESYSIIGYYENFSIRGYTLDLASAYRINGFVVPGEMHFGLDDKERIEVLQGVGTHAAGATGPGGILNFVTKRSADARNARVEFNQYGGSSVSVDLGRAVGDNGVGLRVNAAHDELRPYVVKANGVRDFLSLALDLQPSDALTLTADLEYQRRSQPAVPGFQLLGGTVVPGVDPAANINQQPWSRPVQNESTFAGWRAAYRLDSEWQLSAGIGHGTARISDNLAFPSGCNSAPVQFFCGNGDYALYDYHSSELRQTTQADAALTRTWQSGALRQSLSFGLDRIERKVSMHDLYSSTTFDALGNAASGNIATPGLALPTPSTTGANPPSTRARQTGVFAADTLEWAAWRLDLGLRFTRIDQQTPGAGAQPGAGYALPQIALTRRLTPQARVHASYAQGLEFGDEAPLTAENAGALLGPRRTRQLEIGWKQEWEKRAALSAALFRMSRPFDFIEPTGNSFAGLGNFRRAGEQEHTGAEVSGQVALTSQLRFTGSATWLHARAVDTGIAAYEGVQIQNVPAFRSSVTARYAFAELPGVAASLTWLHTGQRNARLDGSASVPGYDRLDAGLDWATRVAGHKATLQLRVTNLTNRFYWRDAGYAYSADLLFPGAPRQVFAGVSVETF